MIERLSSGIAGIDRPPADAPSTNGRPDRASSGLSLLLIDDNPRIAESLAVAAALAGHALDAADGPEAALSRLAGRRYDVILLDLNYAPGRTGGEEGLALLARILADDPAACVVVMTAHSGVRIAVEAMRGGARDFVMKPWRNAELFAKLAAAVAMRTVAAAEPARHDEPAHLLGESEAIGRVRDLIRKVAPTMAGVVVTGRAGSGRSLAAAAIHAASGRAGDGMMRVDLRDAAAGGRIDGATGTLLLRHPDRLGDVEQRALLDRLPDAVRCVAIADDARAIGPALARRIAAVEIAMPPLAERGDDAVLLARHFARRAGERYGRAVPGLTAAAEAAIPGIAWPDEVRGLAAAIERAVLLGDGGAIELDMIAPAMIADAAPRDAGRFDLDRHERAVIEAALRGHRHNVTRAAAALGLSRGALYRRMALHGL